MNCNNALKGLNMTETIENIVRLLVEGFELKGFETELDYNKETYKAVFIKHQEFDLIKGIWRTIWVYKLGIEYLESELVTNYRENLPKDWQVTDDFIETNTRRFTYDTEDLLNRLTNELDYLAEILERKRKK